VAWCIAADGRKHLLHLAVGNKASEACGTEFFRHMPGHGMPLPTTITSDGAPGLISAITACFPAPVPGPLLVPQAGQYPGRAAR
jgi:transposase-like protein